MGNCTLAASLRILVNPSSHSTYPTISSCSPFHHIWQKAQYSPQKERSPSLVPDSLYEMFTFLEKQAEQRQICWKWCFRAPEKICVLKGLANLPQKCMWVSKMGRQSTRTPQFSPPQISSDYEEWSGIGMGGSGNNSIPKGKYSFLINCIPFIHDSVIAFCLTESFFNWCWEWMISKAVQFLISYYR